MADVMAEEETGGGRLLASRRLRPELREECAGLISERHGEGGRRAGAAIMGGRGKREDEGAKGRPLQIRHALHGSGRHGRRAGLRHCRRYGRGREEGGGMRRGRRAGRCRHGRVWEEGGLGGGPAAAAMGGRGTREEDGAEGRRRRHGRAREVEWELGGGRHHEGGRAVGRRQGEEEKKYWRKRESEGRMKKIGGEHITAGSYYNPAVMLTYHRRFVIRPGGDALDSITAGTFGTGGDRLSPAVIDYHRRFETNRR